MDIWWVVQTVRWNNILKSSEHEAVLTDYRVKCISCVIIKWVIVPIECCGRELLSIQGKWSAESMLAFVIYLMARVFLSLTSHDTYHWFKQAQLMCFQPSSFLNSHFGAKKKSWNCAFLGEHKCIFKVWMLLSGMLCILAGKPLRCTKGPWLLGHSWRNIFLKCFLDLPLTWRQAHSSLFPNQSEQNFHVQRMCFQWIRPKAMLF